MAATEGKAVLFDALVTVRVRMDEGDETPQLDIELWGDRPDALSAADFIQGVAEAMTVAAWRARHEAAAAAFAAEREP